MKRIKVMYEADRDIRKMEREERARAKTIRSSPFEPIFRGEKRQQTVDRAIELMRYWRLSQFQYEATTRAGFRSALCLEGYSWQRSDQQAAEIVAEALRIMGAERPSWEAGQKEYGISDGLCKSCFGPLDEETKASRINFCSMECARNARERWSFEQRRKEDARYTEITNAMRRLLAPRLQCAQCHKTFKSFRVRPDGRNQIHCSPECAAASRQTIAERDCVECGKTFRPRNNVSVGLYCSQACSYSALKKQEISRTCTCCGETFVAGNAKALYCSGVCTQIVSKFKAGRPPKRISPPVFDYVFREAA